MVRLADFILDNIEPILVEWEAFARTTWPPPLPANGDLAVVDPATLRDDAEEMLLATAADMKSDQSAAQQASKSMGRFRGGGGGAHSDDVNRASIAHGRCRHTAGFDLAAVMAEYRALRASVVGLWRKSNPYPGANDVDDLTRFHESIDQSLTEAVIAHTELVDQFRKTASDRHAQQAEEMREMNEALIVSNVRHQELAEQAETAERAARTGELRSRKAEAGMRDSEERYRTLFEMGPVAIYTIDTSGMIQDFNHQAANLWGRTPAIGDTDERFCGSFRMFRPDGTLMPHDQCPMAAVVSGRVAEVRDGEVVIERPDGSRVIVIVNIRPLKNSRGEITGAVNCFYDITQRVALETRIREQAEQIANESRRKDEFLAMLSHELRNPLAPIRSAVHLMRTREHGSEDAISRQAREIIERQVRNLTKLVSDLLEVSRVISGRVRLNLQTIDMNQVIEHAMETVKPLMDQHKHEMVFNCCPLPLWCNADATRLEEVFINILNNAAKYTPDGGRIEVWCEQPEGSSFAQFRVRDNGIGIEAKLLPHVFDLFTQADRSLARSAGGLGIGLSLAHRLVDMHGGTIEAKSDGPGQGAEFIVRLASVRAPEMVKPEEPTDIDGLKPEGMRILLVDDNMDLLLILSTTLRQKGYSVQSAYNGPDGLKIAQQWRPDVILLDIGLPGLNGYEVAKRLRIDTASFGHEGFRGRMVAVTGYGRDVDIDFAREAGFDAHLVKPYEFDELEKLMQAPASR